MLRVRQVLPPGVQARYLAGPNLVLINQLEVPEHEEDLVLAELYLSLQGYESQYAVHPRPILQVLDGGAAASEVG